METEIRKLLDAYPKPNKHLLYGTAGFRDRFDLPLHSVFVRMGILAALKSAHSLSACIGVMITASHNPEDDNGIKIVDLDGGMLSQSWEPLAEELANGETNDFISKFNDIIRSKGIDLCVSKPVVVVGRDTRYHSSDLSKCVELGIAVVGGICLQFNEVTTPQLHYMIHALNSSKLKRPVTSVNAVEWLDLYHESLWRGFNSLTASATDLAQQNCHIVVDASCGVGSYALDQFVAKLDCHNASDKLRIEVRNQNGSGKVNHGCGAELVQKSQVPPKNCSDPEIDGNKLMCSFDGDADRIVFHGFLAGRWVLLDGDKIAALVTTMLQRELLATGLDKTFSLGIVQTAYANGASTQFLKSQGIHTCVAKTGVKFVHHRAQDFDIGVYFEANGHGTVLFSQSITGAILSHEANGSGDNRRELGFARLQACLQLINQTTGDALSDMLLCISSLQVLNMTMVSWHEMYSDYPSSQVKVQVPDKSMINCSDDETRILSPLAMQADLDAAMQSVTEGRCFVRPSGTEDVVRIYAEAATQEEANQLSLLTRHAIEKHLCQGTSVDHI